MNFFSHRDLFLGFYQLNCLSLFAISYYLYTLILFPNFLLFIICNKNTVLWAFLVYTLLSTFHDSKYNIPHLYFFLAYTSSLHIFVHHCTLKQALPSSIKLAAMTPLLTPHLET